MNLFQFILTVHLVGAAVFGLALIGVLAALLQHRSNWYSKLAASVAGLTLLQLASGIGLFLTVPGQEVISTCAKIGVYVGLAAIAEASLYLRSRQPVDSRVKL